MALTAHDKSIVRRTARELRDAYDRGEDDSLSETVVLSEGYADVHIYPDDRDNVAHVVRAFKRTVRVPMGGRLKTGAKRKAGSKTSARKRVPSKRVANPTKKSTSLDAFTRAYIEAALFSSSDDDGRPLERNYSAKDILGATLAEMKRDCAAFQRENRHDLAEGTATQGGHDFWLTRNREGAGFWGGDWPEPAASNLTKSAHFYGSYDLYVSRGKIRH